MIVVRLSGPPRGKGRGRAVSTPMGARVFTDDKTRKYESQLRYAAQQVMAGAAPLAGALMVIMTVRFPIPSTWSKKKRAMAMAGTIRPCVKPDWDNTGKLSDALNQICWLDDKQIVDGRVIKLYSGLPGLTVEIHEIT